MQEDRIPVLVGCGQITEKDISAEHGSNPIQLMVAAVRAAAVDSGKAQQLLDSVDTVAAVGLTVDASYPSNPMAGTFSNVPKSVATELGLSAERHYYSATGGNTPQMLVNHFSAEIAAGKGETTLLCGAEALRTMLQRFKQQLPLDSWRDNPGGEPTPIGDTRAPYSEQESNHGILLPASVYPLFENALQAKHQRSHQQHMQIIGELYSGFSKVAADNPLAWFPTERSPEELITPTPHNRYIAYPYTKLLNSVIEVNQGAALILTSLAKAKSLGISTDKMVFLRGCGDANDIWHLSDRINYHSSPAIDRIATEAFNMAGRSLEEMDFLDIYSCFPSAVQIACDELGLALDDPRGLSVTGGLPYFGGPGNNYSMHAIAEMMNKLRAAPAKFGLLNANGWYITKHSMGIYSTSPPIDNWHRSNPATYQAEILAQTGPSFCEQPQGQASVETYTVIHNREGPERAIIIGRLKDNRRFLAETATDTSTLEALMSDHTIGMTGRVSQQNQRNLFEFG